MREPLVVEGEMFLTEEEGGYCPAGILLNVEGVEELLYLDKVIGEHFDLMEPDEDDGGYITRHNVKDTHSWTNESDRVRVRITIEELPEE